MDRKEFLMLGTGGLASLLAGPRASGFENRSFTAKARSYKFEKYIHPDNACPVYRVTPRDGLYIHTFFDVCPWSPSGRYLVVTQVPYGDRKPVLGDRAGIAVVDLYNESIRTVYETLAWSFQLGANAQWGNDDRYLYCNDVINYVAVCVRIDIATGETMIYKGPKYDINGTADAIVGSRMELLNATQYGYGIPDSADGFPIYSSAEQENDDGLWYTTLQDNRKQLLFSYGDVRKHVSDAEYHRAGVFYFFHSKFNSANNKILQVVRCLIPGKKGRNPSLFTFDQKTGELHETIDRQAWETKGPIGQGNHPNWHPDGEHIVMNLVPAWEGDQMMRFCMIRYDGSEKKVLSRKALGSGHPSVEPSTRFLITDAYPNQEWVATGDGTVPIRLIDLGDDQEITVCRIFSDLAGEAGFNYYKVKGGGSHFKLDPHPAWSRDYKKICFNGAPGGNRGVYIGELETLLR